MYLSRFAVSSIVNGEVAVCQCWTGAVAILPPEVVKTLHSGNDLGLSLYQRLRLIRLGLLVKDREHELEDLIHDFSTRKQLRGALCLTIVPGYACNCACPTCFQENYDKTGRMTPEVCRAIVGFARRRVLQAAHRAVVVWYYGGEPFVYADICLDVATQIGQMCREHGLSCSQQITTNGTRINTSNGLALARVLDFFYVSISQSRVRQKSEVPYRGGGNSYDDVMAGLTCLGDLGKTIRLRVNVSDLDALYDDVGELCDDLLTCFHGEQYPRITFDFQVRSSEGAHCVGECEAAKRNREKTKQLSAHIRELAPLTKWPVEQFVLPMENQLPSYLSTGCDIELCHYLRGNGFFVTPSGDLYLCNIVEDNPAYRLGSIFEPEAALQHAVYRSATTRLISDYSQCRECAFLPMCMSRCPLSTPGGALKASQSNCREENAKRVEEYVSSTLSASREDAHVTEDLPR